MGLIDVGWDDVDCIDMNQERDKTASPEWSSPIELESLLVNYAEFIMYKQVTKYLSVNKAVQFGKRI
jgi:hypothetical protein